MPPISPEAAAAREHARHATGEFGVQQHTAPDAPTDPATEALTKLDRTLDHLNHDHPGIDAWYATTIDLHDDGRTYPQARLVAVETSSGERREPTPAEHDSWDDADAELLVADTAVALGTAPREHSVVELRNEFPTAAALRINNRPIATWTPGDPHHHEGADPGNPLGWSGDRLAATAYPAPMRLNGLELDPHDAQHLGRRLIDGAQWAHRRGDQPDDIAEVRRWAGQMSDDDFRALYARAIDGPAPDPFDRAPYQEWADALHRDAVDAHTRASGTIDGHPDSGTSFDGYRGATGHEGARYLDTAHLDQNEIGARIRGDIAAAKRSGYLPADLKVSIRQRRGTSDFNARIVVPDALYERPAAPAWENPGYSEWGTATSPHRPRKHPFAVEVKQRVERIAGQYAARDVNSMADYHDAHRTTFVDVDTDDPHAERDRYYDAREADRQHYALDREMNREDNALRRAADRLRRRER